jgi:hypothetical protein
MSPLTPALWLFAPDLWRHVIPYGITARTLNTNLSEQVSILHVIESSDHSASNHLLLP